MYIPAWASAALAVLNSLKPIPLPLPKGPTRYIIAKHDDGTQYYLSADKVEEGVTPHLVKFEGDNPPGNLGVWRFSPNDLKLETVKVYVPDTHWCLKAIYNDQGELTGQLQLANCDHSGHNHAQGTHPHEKGESWVSTGKSGRVQLAVDGAKGWYLSHKGERAAVHRKGSAGWSEKWRSHTADWINQLD